MPLYAGFDLGGTHTKCGLIDEKGKILYRIKLKTPSHIKDLILLLETTWLRLKEKEKEPIAACGLGFPGIFNLKEQKIIQSPHFPELNWFDLLPSFSRFIDVPFFLNNDANLAAYGEYRMGAGRGATSLVLLTIGTGIGTGIILDGKLWHGQCGYAGELGHATVNPEGEACHCGSRGCLETEVSALKIEKSYRKLKNIKEKISAEEVYRRAKKGDEAAHNVYSVAAQYLGIGLSIIINFLNPETILLGGGIMEADEFLLPQALQEARRRSFNASFECCRIEKALLGNDAGFIGAALWAQDQVEN